MERLDPELVDPIECDREPIHLPGSIQPHGILLALQEPDLRILHVSQSVETLWGISARSLPGQPLTRLLTTAQVKKIARYRTQPSLDAVNPFNLKIRLKNPTPSVKTRNSVQTFQGILHRNPARMLILELEPYLPQERHNSLEFYHLLQGFMLNLRQVETLQEFAHLLACEVRTINQFDRVMVYQFDPLDQSGVVISEAKADHLDSYLGLRYPASDIPQKARALYYENWVRTIPDVTYSPSPILSIHDPGPGEPLDLSHAVLRSVFPGHLEYLQNMGVAASMSISIISENRLWGLITCLHYTPRYVDYKTRRACEFLGQFASIELVRQQELENSRYQLQTKTLQEQLRQAFVNEGDFVQQVLEQHHEKLLNVVGAQGVAILLNDQLTLIGCTPPEPEVRDLLGWFLHHHSDDLFFTHSLSQVYAPAQSFCAQASGVAIASIFIKQTSHHILWFRPEQIQIVQWAGAASNPIVTTHSGERRYTPRTSFALWQETVRGKSLPWTALEMDAVRAVRAILLQALLDVSQAAIDRATLLERAAAEARIASRAKSQFLAKMSHELRTPLTAILGFSRLVSRDRTLGDRHKEHLDVISRSGEHLLSLINDVLEMSKIESGQVTLTENPFDLYRLLYSLRDMFAIKALNKDLVLQLEIARDLPQYVYGDEGKLRQILLNLISNAIKFTYQGTITLRAWATQPEQRWVSGPELMENGIFSALSQPGAFQFEVTDTGIGLAPGDLDLIFEAFKQTDQGRCLQGSGLGLSISRQFAQLMGGDVTAQSTLGQGSTFLCCVQLRQVAAPSVLSSQSVQLITGLRPGQPAYRILVVEDIPETRQLITNLISSVGLEVQAAQNGEEAIALWQNWQPHLIWMDIRMPGIDGHEATRRIRAMPGGSLPKIIALTAGAFEEDRIASLAAGCDDFVTKPFTETNLFEKMACHLGLDYVVAEVAPLGSASQPVVGENRSVLTAEDLGNVGQEWLAAMHQAALLLDESALYALIEQLPPDHSHLAQPLNVLVSQLQFEVILTLTQFSHPCNLSDLKDD